MLETLTTKQEALMEKVAAEYIRGLSEPPKKIDMGAINRWLDVVYGLYDMKRPARIEVCGSPMAALRLASELLGTKETDMDWCGVGDGGWVSFYDYFNRIGVLTDEESSDVLAFRDFGRTAWDTVLLDECAIVIRRPAVLHLDDDGNIHSPVGKPAIEWADGETEYAHHGTWISERIVKEPQSFTRTEYQAITNTEERRALAERAGWDFIASMLGATVVDSWTDAKTKLRYELLRCDDGSKLLRKQSPKLKNNKQPTYVEPVHEQLRTARAARKWQATSWAVDQCESDPELSYGVEA